MSEPYLDAQRRRRGPNLGQLNQGELTEEDRRKTYHDEAHSILGCQHYRRGAKLQCSTCNHWATCRYCHDEREDHKLIRYMKSCLQCLTIHRRDTRNMICMYCSTPQKAAQYCHNCHTRLARYYCEKVRALLEHILTYSVICGTTRPQNQYIIAGIAGYAVSERD